VSSNTFEEGLAFAARAVPILKQPWQVLNDQHSLVDEIARDLDMLHTSNNNEWSRWKWLATEGIAGALGNSLTSATFEKHLADVVQLVIRKQRDYGTGNILWGGAEGVVLRCHDKLERIKHLLKKGATPENESLTDSWNDITGYALLGMMLCDNTFTLPLEADLSECLDERIPRHSIVEPAASPRFLLREGPAMWTLDEVRAICEDTLYGGNAINAILECTESQIKEWIEKAFAQRLTPSVQRKGLL
jgi:hypothetical protein